MNFKWTEDKIAETEKALATATDPVEIDRLKHSLSRWKFRLETDRRVFKQTPMTLTENEKKTIMAVFWDCMCRQDLSYWMGSITQQEMSKLYHKLKYEDYCKNHYITYEEMTEEDFIQAEMENCND